MRKLLGAGALLALLSLPPGCRTTVPEPPPESGVAPLVESAERARARADYDTAIVDYRRALERTPWNTRIKRALAAAHAGRAARARDEVGGRAGLRSAEADLRAALELEPDARDLQRDLAVVLVEQAAREPDPARAGAMREEARGLAPDLVDAVPRVEVRVERQLDLAYQLIQGGQLEAAIQTLEHLRARNPDHPGVAVLLARASVRRGTVLAERGNLEAAGASLDRAVELYAGVGDCSGGDCTRGELALAHQNRIRVWLHADALDRALRALADAEAAGLSFPELRAFLRAP